MTTEGEHAARLRECRQAIENINLGAINPLMRSKELVEMLRSEGISINWASLMQAIHRRRIRAPLKDRAGAYFFGTDEIGEARAYFSKTPPAPNRRPSRRTTKVPLLIS